MGRNGIPFNVIKFRTMIVDAENQGPAWTTRDDPRVTRVGRILRRTALDELPEIISIWKGHMSFVGPRALDLDEERALEELIPGFERRLQVSERQHGESTVELPDRPIGVPESYDEHAKLMFDLLAVAFKADITRVFVFTLGKEQTNRAYPELGVNAAHHAVSHHQHDPVKFEQGAKVNQYHISLTAHFLDRLKSTPDGDGNLLDHSLVLHGGGISDANEHSHIDLPLVLVGGAGGVKGGRILRHPRDTPMNNLLVAMLERVGVHTDTFGDATGKLPLEPLSGV